MAPATAPSDKTEPWLPLAGLSGDGWSNDQQATATCHCGAVQLIFPTTAPGLVDTFQCNCTDCHKFSASMFASNFSIKDEYLVHARGREVLKEYAQSGTINSGNTMTNSFCSRCGCLMYRVSSGWQGHTILRIGSVDDFNLHNTLLRPKAEQFVGSRADWVKPTEGASQIRNDHLDKVVDYVE